MTQIEHLLRQRIGLDASSIGSTVIERIVRLRMKGLGLRRVEDYKRLLGTASKEWAGLIESVVVTETWFFRDKEAFAAFVRVVEEWLSAHPTAQLRVLSIPCSSGEEPYSLAMALMDAAVPHDRFHIEGIDISVRALDRAQRGVYGRNSFRGQELAFRDRYFQASKDGYVLSPSVRSRVQFRRENVLSDAFTTGSPMYHVIFCRNLLIYFDAPTQRKVFQRLNNLLAPDGMLFVGPAETPLALANGFVSANLPMAFACRKPGAQPAVTRKSPAANARSLPMPPPVVLPSDLALNGTARAGFPAAPAVRVAPSALPPDLLLARRLADEGRFKDALELCHAHLREHGASAQAHYLVGLVHDANGHSQAEQYYRKALYLDPNHYETLLQMALLLQKNGDAEQARTFRRRAQRTQQKN
jgi:chemotaxis protein methyltransferase WspC